VRRELERFGPQAGMAELVERWPHAVGDAIARNAWPARIARDGTVHVNTADSIWAFELGHRGREIAAALGVDRLRFAPGPLPQPAPPEARRDPPRPTRADDAQAAEIASVIEDEDLREAVQNAVRLSLAKAPRGRPV